MQIGDEIPICKWENDTENWEFGDTKTPFTKEEIIDFVNNSQNLKVNTQLRLMVCLKDNTTIGCVDFFEFDEQNNSAGVGILIGEKEYRKHGYANQALSLLKASAKDEYQLTKLFCNIAPDNKASIRLFEKNGFEFIQNKELFGKQVNYYEIIL